MYYEGVCSYIVHGLALIGVGTVTYFVSDIVKDILHHFKSED